MTTVAVAGGLGDLGRLIASALFDSGKHEVYILSRRSARASDPPSLTATRTSPLTGLPYSPLVVTEYAPGPLSAVLTAKNITAVICALIMDSSSASEAQLHLITAADACPSVTRFIPSEFNVDYALPDSVLPYPEKRFHVAAREALRKTKLEYAFVYTGMFADYFGKGDLRPLCFFVDVEHGAARLPDADARMSVIAAADMARYVALALDLERWPRVLVAVAESVTPRELVELVEKITKKKMEVTLCSLGELLKRGAELGDLPGNVAISREWPERFPGGMDQLRALIADLEASVALGAYDLSAVEEEHLDLVKAFESKVRPKRLEEVIREKWAPDALE